MDITWLDIWKFHGAALLAGCVIDWIIGDPIWFPHPVRLMGTMIAGTESRLRKWTEGTGRKGQSRAGVILAVFMCIIWWCVPWAIVHGTEHLWLSGAWAVLLLAEGFLCSLMLAARGLYTESMKVCRSLEEGSTEEARYNVSMIVGRDTAALDEGGIARAAVETVAENASDGVIAPFLFMALLGPAGGTLYKAVNTMDSMVGYKNDRYMYFGRCAARLDDCRAWTGLMPLRCSFGTGNAMPALIPPTARPPVQAPSISAWPVTPGTSELFIKSRISGMMTGKSNRRT